jgi:hypothetical protein
MDSVALLSRALEAGLEVDVRGDKLVVRGPRTLESLARALLANKDAIVRLLEPDVGAREPVDVVRKLTGAGRGHVHAPLPVEGKRYLYRCECGDEFDTTPGPMPPYADLPPAQMCRRCRGYGWKWTKIEWTCLHCGNAAVK